jgi:hypothetical protein
VPKEVVPPVPPVPPSFEEEDPPPPPPPPIILTFSHLTPEGVVYVPDPERNFWIVGVLALAKLIFKAIL